MEKTTLKGRQMINLSKNGFKKSVKDKKDIQCRLENYGFDDFDEHFIIHLHNV